MLTEIGYIKAGVDDIKIDQRLQRDEVNRMKIELAEVILSDKQAHKRINEIVGREKTRED